MSIEVLDLFAGAGGFSVGAHRVTDDVLGIELDTDAVSTQLAAGMKCEQRDITDIDPNSVGKNSETARLHLHASPPCQTFSAAGKGHGRAHIETLGQAVRDILAEGFTGIDLSEIPQGAWLVLTPARWIHTLMPDSVSLEQVRSVLPIWQAYAEGMADLGYFSWTALLNAEQYGVPQTRCRAWLGASLHKVPEPPAPTHSRYHVRAPQRLDEGVEPWVSMAEALGWGLTERGAYTVTGGGTATGGAEPFGNGARKQMQRAEDEGAWSHWRQGKQDRATTHPGYETFSHYAPAGVSQKSHPARPRQLDAAPAPTVTSADNHYFFNPEADTFGENLETPATTIQGDDRVWPRGHKVNQDDINRLGEDEARARYGDRAGTKARRVTVDEAGILQGFASGYPWQGTRTSQFRQVGNAVCPAVAEAVLRSVL